MRRAIATPNRETVLLGVLLRWYLRRMPKRERRAAIRELDDLFSEVIGSAPLRIVRLSGPEPDTELAEARIGAVAVWAAVKGAVASDVG